MTSSPDLLANPSTERYRLGKLLGNGGFGDVHEAWDPALQRSVAIKRLKPDLVRDQPDNLLQEARLAASLRHPAFIQIYSLEDDGHSKSIVMDLVWGEDTASAAGHDQAVAGSDSRYRLPVGGCDGAGACGWVDSW